MSIDHNKMDMVSRSAFKPIYPVVVRQIMDKVPFTGGICADIGAGPASLAIEMAKISDFNILALDISREMSAIAARNIGAESLSGRITPIRGDVGFLPFDDCRIDLIISRGSMIFWKDKEKAFSEIYRVLRHGGYAYVGGGYGTPELKQRIVREYGNVDGYVRNTGRKK